MEDMLELGIEGGNNKTRSQSLLDQQWTESLTDRSPFKEECFRKREVTGDWTRGLEREKVNK